MAAAARHERAVDDDGLALDITAQEIGRGAKASAGYELTSYEPRDDLRQVHTLRLGFAFALN